MAAFVLIHKLDNLTSICVERGRYILGSSPAGHVLCTSLLYNNPDSVQQEERATITASGQTLLH